MNILLTEALEPGSRSGLASQHGQSIALLMVDADNERERAGVGQRLHSPYTLLRFHLEYMKGGTNLIQQILRRMFHMIASKGGDEEVAVVITVLISHFHPLPGLLRRRLQVLR